MGHETIPYNGDVELVDIHLEFCSTPPSVLSPLSSLLSLLKKEKKKGTESALFDWEGLSLLLSWNKLL